jgi:hypothetical protein
MAISIVSLYRQLFGKRDPVEGNVIDMSEHGRQGGLSTGQGYKTTRNVEELTYIDAASSSVTYIGFAQAGTATSSASWMIKKILISGNVTSIAYAGGEDNYNQVWDNRASLVYS